MSVAVANLGGCNTIFWNFSKKSGFFLCCRQIAENKIFVRINITAEATKSGFFTKAKDKSKADDLTTLAPEIY